MRTPLRLALIALSVVTAAACGRGPENPAGQTRAPRTESAAPATGAAAPSTAAGAPSTAPAPAPTPDMAAAAEMRKAIQEYQLTDKTLDGIIASEKELGDFWANPEEARKIRGERSLAKILTAIDASPRLKATITKHGLAPRDYIVGTFSMISAFVWDRMKAQDPAKLKGQPQPVSEATLAVVHKREADVQKLLSPNPNRTKPAGKKRPHEDGDF